MLGGFYLGQNYFGGSYTQAPLTSSEAPIIKAVIVTYHHASSFYDEVSPYDSADTYDSAEQVQLADSGFSSIEAITNRSPVIKHLRPSYHYASQIYDEVSEYDSIDTYDGGDVVQTQSGNDILINIPRRRV